ncbi:hypothetical protein CJF42_03325 [Pseudoalteromonas sp. NBT06-2]|uniref:hypothetical protein n=1 Tax=Pseudoalteromonas sp. NBT06-2 TaxID=2025950 RepID=UPI000BA5D414|nr:hypothetical protein [Pseudoalteromonas sp. NBT06-2]PAJ75762.1 hypothetical protein CJF42_03325 [Pseudoalteromonas sp. NBT06-2]
MVFLIKNGSIESSEFKTVREALSCFIKEQWSENAEIFMRISGADIPIPKEIIGKAITSGTLAEAEGDIQAWVAINMVSYV